MHSARRRRTSSGPLCSTLASCALMHMCEQGCAPDMCCLWSCVSPQFRGPQFAWTLEAYAPRILMLKWRGSFWRYVKRPGGYHIYVHCHF